MCNLDAILWFHVECPKHVNEFDTPNGLRRKFRDFFSELKTIKENRDDQDKLFKEMEMYKDEDVYYNYPDDIRRQELPSETMDQLKQFSVRKTP